jgi:hypothetical protein
MSNPNHSSLAFWVAMAASMFLFPLKEEEKKKKGKKQEKKKDDKAQKNRADLDQEFRTDLNDAVERMKRLKRTDGESADAESENIDDSRVQLDRAFRNERVWW